MRSHRSTYAPGLLAALLGLALLAGTAVALAETPAEAPAAALDGATLYATKTCIACHGPDAKTPILPEYPKLAGQSEAYMLRQMNDIKSGARNNGNTPAMAGVMHLVNEAEMEALAKYIAGLTP
jgi:cytochrome c